MPSSVTAIELLAFDKTLAYIVDWQQSTFSPSAVLAFFYS